MRRFMKSAGFAWEGLCHAFHRERNIRIFFMVYLPVIALGFLLKLSTTEWIALLFAGGTASGMELMNTALERTIDVIDEHRRQGNGNGYHSGLKAAKDVAAGASILTAGVLVAVTVMILVPKIL